MNTNDKNNAGLIVPDAELAPAEESATTPASKTFVVTTSRQFPSWLADTGSSLAISTYQSSKVILIGTNKQAGRLSVFERTLERPMGMAFRDSRAWPSRR